MVQNLWLVGSGALFLPLQLPVHHERLESDLRAVQAPVLVQRSVKTMLPEETSARLCP